MKRVLLITIAIILALPTTALAAGKATVTQEAFYVTPFLGYFAGEIYCEITNTGDKPVKLESGVYEFYDADGESIDSGSIYSFYPRILLPGEKGTAIITSGIKEATEPAYIADYSVSVVGKSAKPEDVLRYPVSNIRTSEYDPYGIYQAFYATVNNDSASPTGDVSIVFFAYDANGNILYTCERDTSGMSLLPGSSMDMYCLIDNDILKQLDTAGKGIATIHAIAYAD